MNWYIAVHDGTKWYENGIYGIYWYIPVCTGICWYILTKHMLGLIGRAIMGRFNGYLCCCISTSASTSFHNGKPLSIQQRPHLQARAHARINCRSARAHLHLRPRSRAFARSDFATIPRSSLHAASLPPRLSVLAAPPRRSVLATTVRLSVLAAPPRRPTSLGRPTGTLGARTGCFSVAGPRQVAALSPGSYLPPPVYMSVQN
jgi:hypothetical protein